MNEPTRTGLRFGPLGRRCVHLCVDMQRLFAEETDWHAPWMRRIAPRVERIVAAHPAATIFTRFVTPETAADSDGAWRRYYERWRSVTGRELAPSLLDLMAPLGRFVPPAQVLDKRAYSPWLGPGLDEALRRRGADTVIVTGGETDVCVLGAVLGAVDRGFRTLVVTDALCSSSDESHDAVMRLYRDRFSDQIELVDTATLLAAWIAPDAT